MSKARASLAVPFLLLAISCGSLSRSAALSDTLFFGLSRPGGQVSDAEFRKFVDEVIEPRFPDGFTIWTGEGEWRGKSGIAVHEECRIVQIIHPPSPQADRLVAEIVASYKSQFQQEAVLRASSRTRISF